MSNHTPSPPFAKNHLMGFEMDHDYVPKEGDIYKNIHNNRIVMIVEKLSQIQALSFTVLKSNSMMEGQQQRTDRLQYCQDYENPLGSCKG